jgi:hypothetical protein
MYTSAVFQQWEEAQEMSPLEIFFVVRKRGRGGGIYTGEREKFNRQVGGIKSYKKQEHATPCEKRFNI